MIVLRRKSLPLWGKWQPGGLTEEGEVQASEGLAPGYLSHPLFGGTLPKGEGTTALPLPLGEVPQCVHWGGEGPLSHR